MPRTPDYPITTLFADRWSPRSFADDAVPDTVLMTAFEAARWAPSASNAQPWRFLISRRGDDHWETYLDLLVPRNRLWAAQAAALILIVSDTLVERRGEVGRNVSHSFDAGAAWANFAHQALLLGWHTHGIGGFDRLAARTRLGVPDQFAVEAMVALGKRGPAEALAPDFRPQEQPNGRRPLGDTLFDGAFGAPFVTLERSAA